MANVGVVACAAGGIEQLRDQLVKPLVAAGHQVFVTVTPTAARWLRATQELEALEAVTGYQVRSEGRMPGETSPHPPPDVLVVAPATFNTTTKVALGIADNQALTVVTENLTVKPVVIFPRINAAHARHPAWSAHIASLRASGANVIEGPDVWPLFAPREAPPGRQLPWAEILAAVADRLVQREAG